MSGSRPMVMFLSVAISQLFVDCVFGSLFMFATICPILDKLDVIWVRS